MKKILLIAIISACTCFCAKANEEEFPSMFGGSYGIVEKIVDLPDCEELKVKFKLRPDDEQGSTAYLDLGVMFDCFRFFGLPVFCSDKQYVLYAENPYNLLYSSSVRYRELNAEDLDLLREAYGVDIPDEPKVPFWYAWGGKIVALLLIGFICFVWRVVEGLFKK